MLAFVVSLMMTGFDPSVLTVPIVHAEEIKVWTREEVKALAIKKAKEYGLHQKRFLAVIECENGFNATGQSNHYYEGKREESYGSAQINLPSHPSITKEMAENPDFAIDWMAKEWAKGHHLMWSCFSLLYTASTTGV